MILYFVITIVQLFCFFINVRFQAIALLLFLISHNVQDLVSQSAWFWWCLVMCSFKLLLLSLTPQWLHDLIFCHSDSATLVFIINVCFQAIALLLFLIPHYKQDLVIESVASCWCLSMCYFKFVNRFWQHIHFKIHFLFSVESCKLLWCIFMWLF